MHHRFVVLADRIRGFDTLDEARTFATTNVPSVICERRIEDGRPMLTLKGMLDNPPKDGKTSVGRDWFAEPVQEVDSAHFGLTVISTAALKRTPKPWFMGVPNDAGEWGDGRTDDDIHFWRQFRTAGNRVFVSPRVVLGHGEYVVTWPGKELAKPVFQWATEFCNTLHRPETAWSVPK